MADFCKQCSEELFNKDFGNLAGISSKEETKEKLYAVVICEGCGYVQVDHTGKCVSPNCLKKHGEL